MVVSPFMFYVTAFYRGLDAAGAAEAFPVLAGPVDGVLVTVIDPILVVFEYEDHAAGTMRR